MILPYLVIRGCWALRSGLRSCSLTGRACAVAPGSFSSTSSDRVDGYGTASLRLRWSLSGALLDWLLPLLFNNFLTGASRRLVNGELRGRTGDLASTARIAL